MFTEKRHLESAEDIQKKEKDRVPEWAFIK
jgi:hypothetical protein